MQNLAGNDQADEYIRRELERARIPVQDTEPHSGEVPYTLIGQLGDLAFTRAWYYWVVNGNVPLEVAQELFADPVGVTDIRVAGDCGCPPPEERIKWLTDEGKQIYPAEQQAEWDRIAKAHEFMQAEKDTIIFTDDPVAHGAKPFVTTYHVDTEIGLRIFVDTLKAHGLVPEPIPV